MVKDDMQEVGTRVYVEPAVATPDGKTEERRKVAPPTLIDVSSEELPLALSLVFIRAQFESRASALSKRPDLTMTSVAPASVNAKLLAGKFLANPCLEGIKT